MNRRRIITLTSFGMETGPYYDVYYSLDCNSYSLAISGSNLHLPAIGSTGSVWIPEWTSCIKLQSKNILCDKEIIEIIQPQCKSYTATKNSTFLLMDNIEWVDCSHFSQSQDLYNPAMNPGEIETITFCALEGSLNYDNSQISVVENGLCPTPTTTTTTTAGPTTTTTTTTSTTTSTTSTTTLPCLSTSSSIYYCDVSSSIPMGCSSSTYNPIFSNNACDAILTSSVYYDGVLQNGTLLYKVKCPVAGCGDAFEHISPYAGQSGWFRIGAEYFLLTGSCNNEVYLLGSCPATTTTTSTTTTTTSTTSTTTTSTTTTTTTAAPTYDYYEADEYSCDPCTFVQSNVCVAFPAGSSIVTSNRYYKPQSITGFVYKNFTLLGSPCSPALIMTTVGNSTNCDAACGVTTTTTSTTTTTTTAAPSATLYWSFSELRGANGIYDLYINSVSVETRNNTASGTYTVYVGDVISVGCNADQCTGGGSTYTNIVVTGEITDAACQNNGSIPSYVSPGYTVVSGDAGTNLYMDLQVSCDGGCI